MGGRPRVDLDKHTERAICVAYQEGASTSKLAAKYDVHNNVIRRVLREGGLRIRPWLEGVRTRSNLVGQRFGRLTVLRRNGPPDGEKQSAKWVCQCDCGNKKLVLAMTNELKVGRIISCGCYRQQYIGIVSTTHGEAYSPEYNAWGAMKKRCDSSRGCESRRYKRRGITVCKRWLHSFEAFLADVGRRPSPDHSLDRIDNDGNYEPGNVRWATNQEQSRNRSSNRRLAHDGENLTATEWHERTGLPVKLIYSRLNAGWCAARILTTPQPPKKTPKVPVELDSTHRLYTHGKTGTKIYNTWSHIKTRCNNPRSVSYPNYGGRGIKLCKRWWRFENFMADMGQPPSLSHTIDRIDVNGNYEPKNCRWATRAEQNRNTRRTKRLTCNGETLTQKEWAKRLGISQGALAYRIDVAKWPLEKALAAS